MPDGSGEPSYRARNPHVIHASAQEQRPRIAGPVNPYLETGFTGPLALLEIMDAASA